MSISKGINNLNYRLFLGVLTNSKEYSKISLLMQQNLTQIQNSREVISTVTSKGQITIPVEIRKHLGVNINDRVAFVIESTGKVRVKNVKYPTIQSLRGVAGSLKSPAPSIKEMIRIAREERLIKKYGT